MSEASSLRIPETSSQQREHEKEEEEEERDGEALVFVRSLQQQQQPVVLDDDDDENRKDPPRRHQESSEDHDHRRRRHALGLAAWLQAFWLPTQLRKYGNMFDLVMDKTTLYVYRKPKRNTLASSSATAIVNVDWSKLLDTALRKIMVQDLGDLQAMELWASIPAQEDTAKRGRTDLAQLEKQLSVKVVFLCRQSENDNNVGNDEESGTTPATTATATTTKNNENDDHFDNHVLLVGPKAKVEKKCLDIRNLLSHYYWRLTGKQVNL